MTLGDGFPGASGTADSVEIRKNLAGLIYRDTAGNARSGIFMRHPNSLVSVVAGTWTLSVAAFEGCSVRGGGPVFMANDGAQASPANTSQAPGANSRKDILYFKQNQAASPFSDANNSPIFEWVYGTPSATPVENTAGLAAIPGAVKLATVTVPSTATSFSSAGVTVTATHDFTALSGTPIPVRDQAGRDALANLRVGDRVERLDIAGEIDRWDGTSWVQGDTGWSALTLQNSWVAFGGAYETAKVRRLAGVVFVEGIVKSGTIIAGTVIFNLPVGYRPAAQHMFTVTSNYAIGVLEVKANGDVIAGAIPSNTFLSLDGIRFPAEA